ncbi:polysaccharide biosynthesis protein [Adhaeribacter radiodurans]|uniref:Polysaccharide biosynthesis protein n=1 Tax=Adhaeribacter radiodurans TaxID=2745197 RepID=A0A7L7L995_9BACT|nr:polysaccharide biosynthesis protein [Adhaeribacter radiodurans]QMU28959.1 polysaccharide biosynthesis protein [Adhaeribacter radiodurans]
MISSFLSSKEQGFYYTFGSITALQVFFELGLSYVIIHYASYETAWLTWNNNLFEGDFKAKSRLSSLLHFTVNWYRVVSVCLVVLLLPLGWLFFSANQANTEQVNWLGPWTLLCISTALFLFITPVFSFLEGCGKVKEVALYRIYQSLSNYIFIGLSLALGLRLYSLGIGVAISFLCGLIWLNLKSNRVFLKDIWVSKISDYKINWKQEILPFQWKIAISWLSGYLIFQLFNPILFTFQSAAVAGQMGMSLAAFNGVSLVAMAWVNTKIPTFSVLIAKKEFEELDRIFFKSALQSLVVVTAASFTLITVIYLLHRFDISISTRFLPINLLVILGFINILNQFTFCQAIYLRAHKKEPFLLNSVVGSILTGISTYVAGRYFGVEAVVMMYFLLNLVVGLPWNTYTFLHKRKAWHSYQPN